MQRRAVQIDCSVICVAGTPPITLVKSREAFRFKKPAWLRYRPVPVIPILGARKLSQLQDNLESFNLALSAEQVKALDEASQIDPGFPYHLYAKEQVRAIAYGGMRDQILA